MIYLDHNSTTPMLPEVAAAMAECYDAGYANPASQHQAGRRTRQRLEQAREEIARMLGAAPNGRNPDRLIFTSGGTEANNLAIQGLQGSHVAKQATQILISPFEHPSVAAPAKQLGTGLLDVYECGVLMAESLSWHLNESVRLVSVMLGNNETGVLLPVIEIAARCRHSKVPMHTDAAQVVGKIPVNFRDLGVTAMTVAAHKFHGPIGIGAIVISGDAKIAPQLHGGFQQGGLRPGTEPLALAVGMEAALMAFMRDQVGRTTRMQRLRDRFEAALLAGYPRLVINGRYSARLPGTSNVAFVGLDRQQLFLALDLAGVCCSTGSACASGSSEPSPVLQAMGLPPEVVNSSLRFSLGATTTEAKIDEAAGRILAICGKMVSKLSR